jgi:hypothetical protein
MTSFTLPSQTRVDRHGLAFEALSQESLAKNSFPNGSHRLDSRGPTSQGLASLY